MRSTRRAGCSSSRSTMRSSPPRHPDEIGTWTPRAGSVLDVPRGLRDPHLSALPSRADVPRLPRRYFASARAASSARSSFRIARRRATGRAATPATASSRRRRSGAISATTGSGTAAQLPPVEFAYSEATIDDQVRDVDARTLENLPVGLGRRLPAGSTSTAKASPASSPSRRNAGIYKPNLGGGPTGPRFGPLAARPRPALDRARSRAAGSNCSTCRAKARSTSSTSHPPLAGFHERDEQRGLERVRPVRATSPTSTGTTRTCGSSTSPATASPTR